MDTNTHTTRYFNRDVEIPEGVTSSDLEATLEEAKPTLSRWFNLIREMDTLQAQAATTISRGNRRRILRELDELKAEYRVVNDARNAFRRQVRAEVRRIVQEQEQAAA